MTLSFHAIPTKDARAAQNGALDANKQAPEHTISDGGGNPCRHCLTYIPKGASMLVLGYRPFSNVQPYAEVGPIFLCADECERHKDSDSLPELFINYDRLLIRGYGSDHRIIYGSGRVVNIKDVKTALEAGFEDSKIKYFHLRSAANNCFQAKVSNVVVPCRNSQHF